MTCPISGRESCDVNFAGGYVYVAWSSFSIYAYVLSIHSVFSATLRSFLPYFVFNTPFLLNLIRTLPDLDSVIKRVLDLTERP